MLENHDSKPDRVLNPFDKQWTRVESCTEPVKSEKAIQHSVNNSVSRSRQMVYDYSLSNEWDCALMSVICLLLRNTKMELSIFMAC